MIQQETELEVADNTGAKRVKCFKVLGGSKQRYAGIGDEIICSVREAEPNGSVKKGDVVRCVIVRTTAPIKRKDGYIRFDTNSCVVIDDKKNPKGTRIFGSIASEVRKRGYVKIGSLAPEVI
jgi:large subunit ribosomal protein L14